MVADRDDNSGAESQGEKKRAAEHGVAARRMISLHKRVIMATWVTTECGRMMPDRDRANWGWFTTSSLASPALCPCVLENTSLTASGRKRVTRASAHW